MKYCIKCLSNDARPHLEFNEEGICSACITAMNKDFGIDWKEREENLIRIFDKFRRKQDGIYDCIVPVSGGKDSIYQVHMVKEIYKMNPLCITFRTLARTLRGEENIQALRNMGVDHIDFSPNPKGVNKITKRAFFEYGDCSLLDHLAIYSIIPNLAKKFNIPLVIWGENPLMEYGGDISDQNMNQLTRDFFKKHNILKGKSLEDWLDENLTLEEVQSLIYPTDLELDELGYNPIFIGYYLPWDAQKNKEIAVKYGFKVREYGPIMGLYDYADLDCINIVIHHYFKWLKFGFNRITDNASNEIRKGRMTRDEGIKIARQMDGLKPPKEFIKAFCNQIDISVKDFWQVAEKFRNLEIWEKNENGEWCIKKWIDGNELIDNFGHTQLMEKEI